MVSRYTKCHAQANNTALTAEGSIMSVKDPLNGVTCRVHWSHGINLGLRRPTRPLGDLLASLSTFTKRQIIRKISPSEV